MALLTQASPSTWALVTEAVATYLAEGGQAGAAAAGAAGAAGAAEARASPPLEAWLALGSAHAASHAARAARSACAARPAQAALPAQAAIFRAPGGAGGVGRVAPSRTDTRTDTATKRRRGA